MSSFMDFDEPFDVLRAVSRVEPLSRVVQGSGFRVHGSGFTVEGEGLGVCELRTVN